MLLRHISPRSTDWMDAMDEGSGGRGWEKLAPEEQAKLLRERPRSQSGGQSGAQSGGPSESPSESWSAGSERRPARPAGYFATASPSR
jgi:hypothetical protein